MQAIEVISIVIATSIFNFIILCIIGYNAKKKDEQYGRNNSTKSHDSVEDEITG